MALTPIAFPQTYDAAQAGPNYSASDFRLTAGAALAVPDGSGFGGIQGVRAGSPSPLAAIDGTTVTVAAHMGWLCPWTGNGCYTYALPEPQQVTVDSTTGSYKIAVVLEDKAAGHGNGEKVYVKKYPGYTLDSQIPGLVVARVDDGVASDVAPVVSQDATVRVATLEQLQSLKAADGTKGVLADGARYERQGGVWSIRRPLVDYISSPDRRVYQWTSSWTGKPAYPAGTWYTENTASLTVQSPSQGRWYVVDMGERILGPGEGFLLAVIRKNGKTVATHVVSSSATPGGQTDNYSASRRFWLSNGVYQITVYFEYFGNCQVAGGDVYMCYTDQQISGWFVRYVFLTEC